LSLTFLQPRTPQRFTDMLAEFTEGLRSPTPTMSTFPSTCSDPEPVVLCALPFHSLCVHHLIPFFGTIDVAYIPDAHMVGFGSIARLIDHASKRPQVQERLVTQIADAIQAQLSPRGVLVRCRARQLCMELRGAKKRGILLSTASHGALSQGPSRESALAQFRSEETPI
jgi:GTP cyclohydrolase I